MPATGTVQNRIERLVQEVPDLMAELRLEAVLQRVANLAAEIIGARYVAVGLLAPDRRSLDAFIVSGMSEAERAAIGTLPIGRGILGLVIKEGKPIRLRDLSAHPASAGFPSNHPPMKSFLGVPVATRRGVIGELYLTEKIGADEFSEEDQHIAGLLAITTASAVENARLFGEQSRLLQEVQQLHRSRERFFAMVNHELRNALAAVFGWAELMVRKKDPATVPRAAFEILDSAEQAVALINDLLDLSRLDEDRLQPVFRSVDCGAVIRGAIQRVTPEAKERGVGLDLQVPQEGLLSRTDAHRVEQILVNLLRNAIRHSPAGGSVTATVDAEGDGVVFRVEDEGPGIAGENVEGIFDVYVTTAGEERLGHGLGLPLSRRLARLLKGDLVAVSRPGVGGLFILRVPAEATLP
ncbi:MAG TPA: GAF domain-containing sensor histidine kinase [Gemmatimonadales bacterium]|jgi:signal transduction histidine kinase|nr:GAF domain-containing sensor histidine kinase [Gemmatimonadales bacterium]